MEGDRLPAALTEYYRELDAGRRRKAAACFARNALIAVAAPGSFEVHPRLVLRGPAALASYLAAVPRSDAHEILLTAVEGGSCLIEGVAGERSFAASVQLGSDGLIERYLEFSCVPVVPLGSSKGTLADARRLVDRYFEALGAGRFEEAAECFGEEVLYSHPPYRHSAITDDRRVEVRGRAALLDLFRRRGRTTYRYRMEVMGQRGSNAIFEATVVDLPNGGEGSALGSLSLGPDGLIDRYLAFYCEPAIPRARGVPAGA